MSKLSQIFILTLTTLLAYGLSLRYGFSQDDWFHLTISRADNFREFLSFFDPTSVSWIFFRPLSTQLPYFLATTLVPLSLAPYLMHLAMLALQVANSYLVVRVSGKLLKPYFALILGIIYSVSSLHFLSLFYIGAIQQLITTLFSLLAIQHVLVKKNPSHLVLGLLTLAAILSKELALRLPLIIFVISYLKDRRLITSLRSVAAPLLVTILYFGIRYVSPPQVASEYGMDFGLGPTLATIMWYVLFLVGFPERLLSFGLSGGVIDFASFIRSHTFSSWVVVSAGLVLLIIMIYKFFLTFKDKSAWLDLSYPALALVSIAPILFLPTHRYPHYLDLAILFMGIFILKSLTRLTWHTYAIVSLIVLGMLSSISIERSTHWTIKRAMDAQVYTTQILDQGQCDSPEGVVFRGSPDELQQISYAMSDANGPRVICDDPVLEVQYEGLP